jgi:phosphatidylglycerol lysyltransferase
MPAKPSHPKPPGLPSWLAKSLTWGGSLLVLGVAAWFLHRYLAKIAWHDVATAWSQIPDSRIAASFGAALLSLAMLSAFDVLAARTAVPGRVSIAGAAFAGAVTQAVSNTLGFQAVTSAAVRFRIYSAMGVSAGDVARIVSLAGLGVALGFAVAITGALCWQPAITHGWGRLPGIVLALLLIALLAWLSRRTRTVRLWHWTLAFPSARIAAMQMLIGGVEMAAAIGALYVLLPAAIAPPFIDFLPIYVGAVVAGLVSHSPGGLGVFESIMLASFPAEARADLLAAMLCYRLTYYLLPFVLGCMALGAFEIRRRRGKSAG